MVNSIYYYLYPVSLVAGAVHWRAGGLALPGDEMLPSEGEAL